MTKYLIPTIASCFILLSATAQADNGRWYGSDQLDKGGQLFQQLCASCHGANAELTIDWKKTDSNGKYPPPPLNGTAHAWHHSLKQLKQTIKSGGVPLGGVMPAFESKLSDADIDAVICLGCVIQGETPHFDYICQAIANGITNVALKFDKPIIFGVLTTLNQQQALDRAGGKHGNKGDEASATAIKMLGFY